MRGNERRTARTLLVAVGAGSVALQWLLLSIHRAVSWDEAVYLSQVTPGMRAMPFVASRARGITLLVWPVVRLGGSLVVVRLVLSIASGLALVAAFAAWLPLIGVAAPLAAFAFGSTWLALLYGSEVMPNLWTALIAVGAIGVAARALADPAPARWIVPMAAGLLALLCLFRPPDGVPVLAAILVAAVGTGVGFRRAALLAAGLVAGWIPWIVEMSVRFGGPLDAIRRAQDAAHVGTSSIGSRIVQHLALSNDPTLGPSDDPHIAIGGVVWWAALLVLAGAGLASERGTPRFRPLLAATIAGLGLAAEYLLLVEGLAPRFLLPSYALLSIPSAVGLLAVVRRLRSPAARVAFVAVVAVPWLVWQVGTADRIEAQTEESRVSLRQVGLVLAEEAGGRPCAFASTDGFPQIEYVSGCVGRTLGSDPSPVVAALEDAAARGDRVFLVLRSPPPPATPRSSPEALRTVPAPRGQAWYLYELVPHGSVAT